MDLRERQDGPATRHPWEVARLAAIRSLLRYASVDEMNLRILDVGCGDGFVSSALFGDFRVGGITGVDTNLTDQEVSDHNLRDSVVTYVNSYSSIKERYYGLILLLDVIEHVSDDRAFLLDLANRYLADPGYVVITAPAYGFLFGPHDRFLEHHRRYNRRELIDLVNDARLDCLASGYFFLSLLPIRAVQLLGGKMTQHGGKKQAGVGVWRHHRWLTKAIAIALEGDARLSFALNRIGIVLPGLTVWAVCRKRRS